MTGAHVTPKKRKRETLGTMLSSSLGVAVYMLVAAVVKKFWGVDITMQ
jgi:hypothetical protein